MRTEDADLLIIGAGMAGLTAGARAVRDGLSVVVVEIGTDVGGSARFAGYAWTAPSHDVMDEHNPRGDSALKRALVNRFADGISWIRSVGVEVKDAQRVLSFGRGHQFDTNHYVDTCRRLILHGGGELLLETRTERLVVERGVVAGADLRAADGTRRQVRARTTLIATGGFQGDPALRTAHVHPRADRMPLRSQPHSDGGGYRLATGAGAATASDDAGFYGHLVPSGVPFADPADFVDLSLYYSEHAVLFNLRSERFVDETLGDHLTAMALLDQPEGRGLLVADARVFRDWIVGSYVEGAVAVDKYALASKRGGRVGLAEDLDELAFLPEEWGYDGEAVRDAVKQFNERASEGAEQRPGRKLDSLPLDEPPYYVIETVPAITFPFHGVRVDDRARVLHDGGRPIEGLLAAGSDTGGLWHRAYAGGIASALVFGLTAADTAREMTHPQALSSPPALPHKFHGGPMFRRHPEIDPQLLSETDEQRQLRAVLRDFFTEASGSEDVRRQSATARGYDEVLWARLAGEIGVHGLAIPEEYGGSGFTFAELAVALEESGRALYCAPLLPTVVLAAHALLGSGDRQACERHLPRIADGTLTATVAGFHEDGPEVDAEPGAHGWVLRGAADLVLDGAGAELIVVRARTPDGPRLFACEPAVDTCLRTPRRVLDETRRQALVEFRGAPATPVGESGQVTATLDAGRAALGAEQVGGSGHALDATVEFVANRHQFGRPIGSFQAVKHRLADVLVALEAARSASAYATACVAIASPQLPVAAGAAAVVCSETFRLATAEYVQLYGGIGFTWEHPAHLYVRRARSSEVLFGTADRNRARLAELTGLASSSAA
ncbi:FAD-binding protein [Streptomyces sp. NPDC048484]|uniref:FAD-binding protein n=1 Tax=Streptomyces sp. NPDC048484 TaxID=3155146 RepID=UPI0034301D27